MIIKATLSGLQANRIRIGDFVTLKTTGKNSKSEKEFLVKIVRILSDIPKCSCGRSLENKQSYKYKTGIYCKICYDKRK